MGIVFPNRAGSFTGRCDTCEFIVAETASKKAMDLVQAHEIKDYQTHEPEPKENQ
ncbi:hypothetical protein GCM10009569_34600 [Arthrobacter russicus]|uniref:Uncharacterized protein n=1 Tax=Arthrobacter russicus TaxID=172040 RepID=A0ABU1JDW9_9MICC|nr:hypothetical protein [Arthrobacter russicus]MDR6270619.1 hypothetical protein [Arthrobacter russicus]